MERFKKILGLRKMILKIKKKYYQNQQIYFSKLRKKKLFCIINQLQ